MDSIDRSRVRQLVIEVLREAGPAPITGAVHDRAEATSGSAGPAPAPPAASSAAPWTLPPRYVGPILPLRSALSEATAQGARAAAEAPLRVAIGSDHGGFDLKRRLKELLLELGHRPVDVGTHAPASCDYPDFARKVGEAVRGGKAQLGIMIDGAGIGSAMVLNKMPGIRAATVHSEATAVNSRAHNDANVLVLGSMQMHPGHAARITRIWLQTPHEGGRHARRVSKIDAMDAGRG
jgi:ribose 5-phosphate isomerase B